ncbi:tetratricopeptide repeat protein [Ferruginibacter albus]|uniref:tetratricopeptide repeat protein n=1 Tax=Ferruginibacter albus TaxID=2875540 RepID=UPI001CC43E7E|nr:hypothetical protein [Ferruginibacter albus]UAY51506.1 hypothetical protein K9M53_13030 [Ferruginibacter albus]
MKYIFVVLTLITAVSKAQTGLTFDKYFVESEDKWVAFSMNEDSSYSYGFIYIDEQAGLTFNYEGRFKVALDGHFIPKKMDTVSLKYRLQPNNVKVAFIPQNRFQELQIQATPDWLKYYKTDTNSVERLYRWGFMYNGWNQCAKALTYLEKANTINSNYKGLQVELAFSYNCLELFDKAIAALQLALKQDPTDAYTNKELVYAQLESGDVDKAAESCKHAIATCTDKSYNGENCYNLLHTFFIKKDKKNFYLWLDETKKWTADKPNLIKSIKTMEDEMKK